MDGFIDVVNEYIMKGFWYACLVSIIAGIPISIIVLILKKISKILGVVAYVVLGAPTMYYIWWHIRQSIIMIILSAVVMVAVIIGLIALSENQ